MHQESEATFLLCIMHQESEATFLLCIMHRESEATFLLCIMHQGSEANESRVRSNFVLCIMHQESEKKSLCFKLSRQPCFNLKCSAGARLQPNGNISRSVHLRTRHNLLLINNCLVITQ